MAVVRLSLGIPKPGQQEEVHRLYDELDQWLSQHEGYVMGLRFHATDLSGEEGRLAVWVSREVTDHVASLPHTMALRSRINALLEPGHLERLYELRTAHFLPTPLPRVPPHPERQG